MGDLLAGLRHAATVLLRRPGFALMTLVTLARAIAANTTILALVEATVLRRPPYPDPARLVVAREVGTRGQEMSASWPPLTTATLATSDPRVALRSLLRHRPLEG